MPWPTKVRFSKLEDPHEHRQSMLKESLGYAPYFDERVEPARLFIIQLVVIGKWLGLIKTVAEMSFGCHSERSEESTWTSPPLSA
jgi:hypothetical protein